MRFFKSVWTEKSFRFEKWFIVFLTLLMIIQFTPFVPWGADQADAITIVTHTPNSGDTITFTKYWESGMNPTEVEISGSMQYVFDPDVHDTDGEMNDKLDQRSFTKTSGNVNATFAFTKVSEKKVESGSSYYYKKVVYDVRMTVKIPVPSGDSSGAMKQAGSTFKLPDYPIAGTGGRFFNGMTSHFKESALRTQLQFRLMRRMQKSQSKKFRARIPLELIDKGGDKL